MVIWLLVLAVNSGPLATLENWYTDNARDSYVASLFPKDGFSIFSQPLSKLASVDISNYKYVTWPQMPHLYPLGSVLMFLPFGILIQNGFNSTILFKIEIAIFLVIASACAYFFLKVYLKKDMALILKLLGVYVVYVTLVAYAADGMFESVAFIFALFAVYMFITERYEYFFLLVTVSTFFKYEAAIFLFPLIVVGLVKLVQKNKLQKSAEKQSCCCWLDSRRCKRLHGLPERSIPYVGGTPADYERYKRFFIQHTYRMAQPILLRSANACSDRELRPLHAQQKHSTFPVRAFSATAKLHDALLPKLVFTLHFCLRTYSPAEKRGERHRGLANLYGCCAGFFRNQFSVVASISPLSFSNHINNF